MALFWIFYFCILSHVGYVNCSKEKKNVCHQEVIEMEMHARVNAFPVPAQDVSKLTIFCYSGDSVKTIGKMFTSATFRLWVANDDYRLYSGSNEMEVCEEEQTSPTRWYDWIPWKIESMTLDIFNRSCIGVKSKHEYRAKLNIKAVDPWIVSYLAVGLILFFTAERLSKNVMLYYGGGVSVGVLMFTLILLYIFSRFLPKKRYGAFAVIIGGSTIVYVFKKIWESLQLFLDKYFPYLVGYLITTVILSFSVCYYKGPPTDPRKLDLIKWGIQLLALLLMYYGTQIQAVSVTIIIGVVLKYNFPAAMSRRVWSLWQKKFPRRQQQLLTEEEFLLEGQEETRKELEKLRAYCRSPDCDAWKTISRLHTPHKFSKFVAGGSHVTDDEFAAYDSMDLSSGDIPSDLKTDDEDEMDFIPNGY